MKYTYDTYIHPTCPKGQAKRIDTTTNFSEAEGLFLDNFQNGNHPFILVTDNTMKGFSSKIENLEDLEGFRLGLEMAIQWRDKPKWDPLSDLLSDSPQSEEIEETFTAVEAKIVTKDHINPSHYKAYLDIENNPDSSSVTLQWLESMQYLPHFRNPENFKAAVELQVRKYLDRSGGKDSELQETKKALWYLRFLTAYIANGNTPIRIRDIQELLKGD
jgi:hypothetical protein